MNHQGRFKPKNPDKYLSDPTKIFYRSGWELSVMLWCDKQVSVIAWCSEDIVIPYLCPTDNKIHQYFVDFLIKFKNGKIALIEVKPKCQVEPPVLKTKKPGIRYKKKVFTHIKNKAKWTAAEQYATNKGWEFKVWTEATLKQLGILGKN